MFLPLPQLKQIKPLAGFTLIEVIIVTAIVALLSGGGIASFIKFNEKQQVLSAARDVQQALRIAQTKARAREVPQDPDGTYNCDVNSDMARIVAYRVYAPSGSGSKVKVIPICNDSLSNYMNNLDDSVISALPGIIEFDLPESINLEEEIKIDYLTLYGGANNISGAKSYHLSYGNYRMEFSINDDGLVTDVKS